MITGPVTVLLLTLCWESGLWDPWLGSTSTWISTTSFLTKIPRPSFPSCWTEEPWSSMKMGAREGLFMLFCWSQEPFLPSVSRSMKDSIQYEWCPDVPAWTSDPQITPNPHVTQSRSKTDLPQNLFFFFNKFHCSVQNRGVFCFFFFLFIPILLKESLANLWHELKLGRVFKNYLWDESH